MRTFGHRLDGRLRQLRRGGHSLAILRGKTDDGRANSKAISVLVRRRPTLDSALCQHVSRRDSSWPRSNLVPIHAFVCCIYLYRLLRHAGRRLGRNWPRQRRIKPDSAPPHHQKIAADSSTRGRNCDPSLLSVFSGPACSRQDKRLLH